MKNNPNIPLNTKHIQVIHTSSLILYLRDVAKDWIAASTAFACCAVPSSSRCASQQLHLSQLLWEYGFSL